MNTIEWGASEAPVRLTDHHNVYCTCHLRRNICQCAASIAGRSYCAILQTILLFDMQCNCAEVKVIVSQYCCGPAVLVQLLVRCCLERSIELDDRLHQTLSRHIHKHIPFG